MMYTVSCRVLDFPWLGFICLFVVSLFRCFLGSQKRTSDIREMVGKQMRKRREKETKHSQSWGGIYDFEET